MKFCMAVLAHANVMNISSMFRCPSSRERHMYRRQSWIDGETANKYHKYLLGEELECTYLCSDFGNYIGVH